jgi:rSAM/selenodomain-associated transferase 1
MNAERRHLVVMARRPVFGQGKRRLAAELGELTAHRFQCLALALLLRRLGDDPRWRLWLALTPDEPLTYPGVSRVVAQGEGDLGDRMARTCRQAPPGSVAIIGSDAPDIGGDDIAAAFAGLERADAVIGPAPDGGYWLIGFSQTQRQHLPFSGERWSTPPARADTLKNLAGKRVECLRELEDVDDAESYARWRKLRSGGRRR